MPLVNTLAEWRSLEAQAETIKRQPLRDLLKDPRRSELFTIQSNGVYFDYTRQNVTNEIMQSLFGLANAVGLKDRIHAMLEGKHINATENRSVLHTALRLPKTAQLVVDGQDIVKDVHDVLKRIQEFSTRVREGQHKGVTAKPLRNVISIGIGGSYLGPEFVYEALKTDRECAQEATGRQLRFLANIDPTDVQRATSGLDPAETLVVIISKTFTTAETMLNARTLRQWLIDSLPNAKEQDIVRHHMIAVSAAVSKAVDFGIAHNNIFGFWDWVGGRYSVCSAVGIVPLALHYGYKACDEFLAGAHDIDQHFRDTPFYKNMPILMGLLGLWNSSFLKYSTRAILPYSQALLRFPAHIQQLDMESNGKQCTMDGEPLSFDAGEINFGEPGTNGQHSFYQLIHQGRVIPCEFIGFIRAQNPIFLKQEKLSNHDELMSNFFAQPDALAKGKTVEENLKEGILPELAVHKSFSGNRPSFSILFKSSLTAFVCGQLLALYEHRTAVEGMIWNINSFDQWGVELGKTLAMKVRTQLIVSHEKKTMVTEENGFNTATCKMLNYYLENSQHQ